MGAGFLFGKKERLKMDSGADPTMSVCFKPMTDTTARAGMPETGNVTLYIFYHNKKRRKEVQAAI